jgi:hypothetical protein
MTHPNPGDAPRPAPPKEPELTLRPQPVLCSVAVATLLSAGIAWMAAAWTPDPATARWAMPSGALAVGFITALSALLFVSPSPRPASLCGSLWLGATLIRFVAVPGTCLFVYWSAPSVGLAAAVSTVGSYLACLAAETVMVVRQAHRSL